MDEAFNFGNPNVNLEEVNALNHSRSVTFVNSFISRTADFLNRYAAKAEENLSAQSLEMQKLEIAINIIEEKLASIPYLKDFKPPTTSTTEEKAPVTSSTPATGGEASAPASVVAPTPQQTPEVGESPQEAAPQEVVAEDFVKVKDDARYAKYFKMVNVGVPKGAIENKMRLEGLNPDLLDDPDAPAPSQENKSDPDSDGFSDDSGSTGSFSD